MPNHYDTQRPYAASYILLRQRDRAAFVLRANTSWMNNYYGLPAGKVESDENFTHAAIREAKEEVGVVLTPRQLMPVLMCHRKARQEDMTWVDVLYVATEWEGQVVNAEPHLHAEVAWFELTSLPKSIIPSQRFMIEQYLAGNAYCEYGWS